MERQGVDFKEIRNLSVRFTPDEIESCINSQIESGENTCKVTGAVEEIINELAKAKYVRKKMEQGVTQKDAVRDLAKKIRSIQLNNTSA
ncbi:MAG: hypothetical protein HQK91_12090 [Nitrospirae bacterium]|nr:hypothetical protein [Nitrospirota bacterium]